MKALPIMWRIIKAAYEDLFLVVGISVLWWAGAILIVTAAPATAGIHAVANRLANYRRSATEFFWSEAKRYPGRAWIMLGTILIGFVLIVFNIWFYTNSSGWLRVVSIIWWWILLFYLMLTQYLFPLLCQQDEPSIRTAMRNAVVLTLRAPLYTLLALLFQVVLVILCGALLAPVILLLPGLLALSSNFFLMGLLEEMGLAEPPPQPAPRD